ncbi:MAG TPA: hypothetical protein VK869_09670 [Rubrobacteraceae bacterium]|nr:hypothetical protein [Rubrobacteraceae bacterium]
MIGYVSVDEQVDADFHRARRRAVLRHWRNRLRRDPASDSLLSFDEAKGALTQWSQSYRGMRTVDVDKITGSVGRHRDFDHSFLPLKMSLAERWIRIDRAYHRGDEVPAVSLYKIGDAYFVRDGNHRVSVARYHRVAAIDAEVVELRGRTDPAHQTGRMASIPAHRPRHRSEPDASWLRDLWQRLRPPVLRPGARTVT